MSVTATSRENREKKTQNRSCDLHRKKITERAVHTALVKRLIYLVSKKARAIDLKRLRFLSSPTAHSALIQSPHDTGIRDVALNWFCRYLSDRIQTVRVGQELGQSRPCSRGVPQGSVLGTVFFCIYIRTSTLKSTVRLFRAP